MKEKLDFLTLENFMEAEGLIERKITDIKSGDVLTVLPEFGAGKVIVQDLHYDRFNNVDGVICADRGIMHPASFQGVSESIIYEANKAKDIAINFAEWLDDNCKIMPDGWTYKGDHYSTEEIYDLSKNLRKF